MMTNAKAKKLTEEVFAELLDKSGFDGWWDSVDAVTQDEVQQAVRDVIMKVTC